MCLLKGGAGWEEARGQAEGSCGRAAAVRGLVILVHPSQQRWVCLHYAPPRAAARLRAAPVQGITSSRLWHSPEALSKAQPLPAHSSLQIRKELCKDNLNVFIDFLFTNHKAGQKQSVNTEREHWIHSSI